MTAPDRILRAAAELIAERGTAGVSMLDVARSAGVSKALIHYHFADRQALLARLVEELAARVVTREAHALDDVPSAMAVDRLWAWLEGELLAGDIRALVDLAAVPDAPVRRAWERSLALRREAAAVTVERLFGLLGLRPRIPGAMLAEVIVAFVDGLAVTTGDHSREPRVAFDVFWLALLSLAE